MSTGSNNQNSISSWLTALPSHPLSEGDENVTCPPSEPSLSPSPTSKNSRKRKAGSLEETSDRPSNRRRLTRSALKRLELVMGPKKDSQAQTPNSSAVSSSRKERANLDDVVRSLQNYGMYYNELDAWNVRCPEFKERVLGPFLSDRHSAMQPASHKRFNEALDRTRYSNEATFHNATLPILFSDEHTVATQKKDFAGSIKLVQLSYAESDGLSSQEKPNLATGFVPGKEPSIKAVGMTNPIPDTVWGKLHPSFIKPGSQGPKDINVIKSSGCHVDWPFFIAEAKSGRGSVADARNQAQRDGGSIIKSLLKLKEYVEGRGYRKKAGAVEDFWVFSLCWDPDYANILVHWVEIMADETEIFHSTKVRQKFLDDEEGQAQLRACGHNIFNHGLFTHVPAMEKLWAKAIKAEKPFDDDFDLYD